MAAQTQAQCRYAQKLTASDGAAGDRFGNSVHVSGNTAVIGASGVERIMPVTLTLEEKSFVQKSAEKIQVQLTRSGGNLSG